MNRLLQQNWPWYQWKIPYTLSVVVEIFWWKMKVGQPVGIQVLADDCGGGEFTCPEDDRQSPPLVRRRRRRFEEVRRGAVVPEGVVRLRGLLDGDVSDVRWRVRGHGRQRRVQGGRGPPLKEAPQGEEVGPVARGPPQLLPQERHDLARRIPAAHVDLVAAHVESCGRSTTCNGHTVESQLYISQLLVPLVCTSHWYSLIQNT